MAQGEKLFAEWFWVDRWMGSSAFALPIDARGLYREMLSQAWRRQAKLPNDHEQIRRLTAVTLKEWRRTWPLVERFWRVDGESLVNDTQLIVYADAKQRSSTATARARAAAQARHKHSPLSLSPGSTTPPTPLTGGRITKQERKHATEVRNKRFGCQHDPRHATVAECVDAIVFEIRSKVSA